MKRNQNTNSNKKVSDSVSDIQKFFRKTENIDINDDNDDDWEPKTSPNQLSGRLEL